MQIQNHDLRSGFMGEVDSFILGHKKGNNSAKEMHNTLLLNAIDDDAFIILCDLDPLQVRKIRAYFKDRGLI
jgi:hypothetical protein